MKKLLLQFSLFFLFYQFQGNVSQGGVPLLLYSTTADIPIVNVTLKKLKPTILYIKNLTDGAAFDFHFEHKKICWTDPELESIQCIGFNSTIMEDKVEVISTGVLSPDGLACDCFTNKLLD